MKLSHPVNKMKVLLVLALIGAAYAAPQASSRGGTRIVGGETTTVDRHPFITNMQYGFFGIIWYQACGGSLITETVSLSAAHCYYGNSASEWKVIVGTSFPSSGGTTVDVRRLTLHRGFSPITLDEDIALVHFATPVTLSNSVQLARIPGPTYVLPDDTPVTVIGYGTLYYQGPSPSQLQQVEVQTVNHEVCTERYAYLKTQPGYQNWPDITKNMLCTGVLDVGGKDACQGDSGGPVAHDNNVIIGITSWGFECADSRYPGVNARVSEFTDWIVENASN